MADNSDSKYSPDQLGAMGGGNLLGGILGGIFSGDDYDQAQQDYQNALQQYQNISVPDLVNNLKQMQLQQYTMGPQMNATLLGPSNSPLDQQLSISENPQNRMNILNSIAQQQGMAHTGFGAQDIANQYQAQNQALQAANSQRQGLAMQAQQQGKSGSGAQLAGQLLAGQQGANQMAESGMQNAAAGASNRANLLNNISNQQSNLRGQDYQTQAQNAQLESLRRSQLAQNSLRSQMANQQAQQQSGMYNTMAAAQAGNANTNQYNQNQMMQNYYAPQQMFNDQLSRASGIAGGYNTLGGQNNARGAATQNTWNTIGKGAGNLGAAFAGASKGGTVPGIALAEGDHPANDTVPTMLSPGEIVIPRSMASNPGKAAQFAKHHATMTQTMKKLKDLLKVG